MQYEILDLSKSLLQEAVVVEAPSPKNAAEKHFGFKVERCFTIQKDSGDIMIVSKSYPRRFYQYRRVENAASNHLQN